MSQKVSTFRKKPHNPQPKTKAALKSVQVFSLKLFFFLIELTQLPVMGNNVFPAIAIQRLYNYCMRKTPLYSSQALLEEEIQLQHIVEKKKGGDGTVLHNSL